MRRVLIRWAILGAAIPIVFMVLFELVRHVDHPVMNEIVLVLALVQAIAWPGSIVMVGLRDVPLTALAPTLLLALGVNSAIYAAVGTVIWRLRSSSHRPRSAR